MPADCLYGDTGTTKTSRLGDAAEYYFAKTGRPAHLVSTDTAGTGPIDGLIAAGVIKVFQVTPARKHLLYDSDRLSKSWWPIDADNPHSEFKKPEESPVPSVLLWDGITTTCGMLLELHQGAVKLQNGTMIPLSVKVPEMPKDSYVTSGEAGEFMLRFLGRSDYGAVQGYIERFVRQTATLKIGGTVVPAIWTALEAKGEDEQKKPIYGPQFVGKALTGVCGPWFGNLIHMDFLAKTVQVPDPADPARRLDTVQPMPYMFLKSHFDKADLVPIKYPAKVRAPRTLFDKVPPVMEPRLDKLYRMLDALFAEEQATRDAQSASNNPKGLVAAAAPANANTLK